MNGGFTFDGVDIETLGLEYAPDNPNTYVYHPAQANVHEQMFDAHDGGYFYGTTTKPKDFTLRCIYQDTHVSSGIMTRLHSVFRKGKTARLVFQKRPWCYYVATVLNVDATQMTNFVNGIVTITMRAYYPYARSEQTRILPNDPNEADLLANSAMLNSTAWELGKDFAADAAITAQKTIGLFNPGTERCPVAIEIAGNVGNGITIYNTVTTQLCEIIALTKEKTTSVNKYLVCDSLSGKVLITNGSDATGYGFLYHDNGFIDLESNYPLDRSVQMTGTSGSTSLHSASRLDNSYIGRYVAINFDESKSLLGSAILGSLVLNNSQDGVYTAKALAIANDGQGSVLTLSEALPANVNGNVTLAPINEIVISPKVPGDTIEITKLVFRYKPTFS